MQSGTTLLMQSDNHISSPNAKPLSSRVNGYLERSKELYPIYNETVADIVVEKELLPEWDVQQLHCLYIHTKHGGEQYDCNKLDLAHQLWTLN